MKRILASEIPKETRKWLEENIIEECERCGSVFIKLKYIKVYEGGFWEWFVSEIDNPTRRGDVDLVYKCEVCGYEGKYRITAEALFREFNNEIKRRRKLKKALIDEL